jgi:pyruvate,orthophosphate dikinase
MTSHAAVVARGMGKPCVCGAGDAAHRLQGAKTSSPSRRAACFKEGRHHHHRRRDRRGDGRRRADDRARAVRRLRHADGLGRRCAAEGARQRRDPADAAPRASSAPRASACAAPSTCSSTPTASRRARDDPGRRREGPPRGAGQAAADAAQPTSPSCSRSWPGLPVTIRLLDPPLHEFLPHSDEEIEEVARPRHPCREAAPARRSCTSSTRCSAIRGCRLGISYPEIYEMQARAIFEAPRGRGEERRGAGAGSHDPAGRHQGASSSILKAVVDRVARRRSCRAGERSTIRSAR